MEHQNVIVVDNATENSVKKILYTAAVTVSGGRDGAAKSNDGRLDTSLSSPGSSGMGTNPEQLFAAGWSACFIGAMKHIAPKFHVELPENTVINTEVDLASGKDGFALQARLTIELPGLDFDKAKEVVEAAHQTCPYSKATRGNIQVEIQLEV